MTTAAAPNPGDPFAVVDAEILEPGEPPTDYAKIENGMSPMGWNDYLGHAADLLVDTNFAVEALRRKAEAAGVLYGESLYRELDIEAQRVHAHRANAFSALLTGRRMAEDALARSAAIIHEYAEDERQHLIALERLSTRVGELEQRTAPTPTDPPTTRASTILNHIAEYLTHINLTRPETVWLRDTLSAYLDADIPALPDDADPANATPSPPEVARAARRWMDFADATGEPITENLALALVAVRDDRGYRLDEPGDTLAARAWLGWARAGFHGEPPSEPPQ